MDFSLTTIQPTVFPGRTRLHTSLEDDALPAGIDDADVPQSLQDLPVTSTTSDHLTIQRAGELKIPIAGGVGGGWNRRVVVHQWSSSQPLTDDNGVTHHFGWAVRFAVTVSQIDATGDISLPFLTAKAQLNQIQAAWSFQVLGVSGPELLAIQVPPKELNIETFVEAQQSLEKVPDAVTATTTTFHPGVIVAADEPPTTEDEIWLAAVGSYAVTQISKRRTLLQAQEVFLEDRDAANVVATMYEWAGVEGSSTRPTKEQRNRARVTLQGISVELD